MAKEECVFKRVEKKYLINTNQLTAFLLAIQPYVNKDKHDIYTISNIYFDTSAFDIINHCLEKPIYKEKLRLRSYGIPTDDDNVFLELKKKYQKVGVKRRVEMTYKQAKAYLTAGIKPYDSQIFHEIDYFINLYHPTPKLYLSYQRQAFIGKEEKELRITVDHSIKYRSHDVSLANDDDCEQLLKKDQYLVEIKTSGAYPLWLVGILSSNHLYSTSFSKYGRIYQSGKVRG